MSIPVNYTLHITDEDFYIQPYASENSTNEVLVINRQSGSCGIKYDNTVPSSSTQKPIYGLVGAIKLIAGNFLIVITGKSRVGHLNEHEVYKVDQFELIPYFKSDIGLTESEKKFDIMYKNMVENFLKTQNFYFSYTFDLTHTMQRLTETPPEFMSLPLYERADRRFIWNYRLLKALNPPPKDADKFLLPIMLGFIEIKTSEINGKKFEFGLVSRRSCEYAGTRFNVRGADLDGCVANFVETEQILINGDSRCSFVQIRGSIPIVWSQKPNLKYKPSIKIDETADHLEVCKRHFSRLISLYDQQVCVNLVNHHGSEGKLEKSFGNMIRLLGDQSIRYESFDFHKQCGTDKWDRLSILINRLANDMDSFGYFLATRHGAPLTQRGIFRTNCIDCLDRTNVVQSLLAKRMLHIQLLRLQILNENESIESHEKFYNLFRNVWADNGDIMSIQYAGTGALKSDFTRSGKRTTYGLMRDGVNSLQRYIINNFYDGFRQDSIDLFLCNHQKLSEEEKRLQPASGQLTLEEEIDLVKCAAAFESDKKYLAIPVIGLGTFSMFIISLLIPAETFQEQLSYVFFWGFATICTLGVMVYFGKEIVDSPRLVHRVHKNKKE